MLHHHRALESDPDTFGKAIGSRICQSDRYAAEQHTSSELEPAELKQ